MEKKSRGKLIVFEGVDHSGKTTQADLLMKYFEEKKIPAKRMRFPGNLIFKILSSASVLRERYSNREHHKFLSKKYHQSSR